MNQPIAIKRASDGRPYVVFARDSEGGQRPLWIDEDDVEKWRARIAGGGRVATKKGKSTKTKKSGGSSTTTLRMTTHASRDYDDREKGWILRGLVETARGGTPQDPRSIFEPRRDDDTTRERARNQKLLELGEELFALLPHVIAYFGISQAEWSSWYRARVSSMTTTTASAGAPIVGSPLYLPPATPAASFQPDPSSWLAPVKGLITSKFGPRNGKMHKGLDVKVGMGTPVIAPQVMRIKKVANSDTAGLHVVGDVMRPDGRFDGDGDRVKLMHLSAAHVREGDVVQKGQVVGLSGNTGNSTGPHLHVEVVELTDRSAPIYNWDFIDSEKHVDPLSRIPEAHFGPQMTTSQTASPAAEAQVLDDGMDWLEAAKDGLSMLGLGAGLAAPVVGFIPGGQGVAAVLAAVGAAAGGAGGVMDLMDGPDQPVAQQQPAAAAPAQQLPAAAALPN